MEHYLDGLLMALHWHNLLFALLGATVGIIVGAVPGIGSTLGIALLLPITYGMDPAGALIMIGGIFQGTRYGDSITAILVNAPGTGGAVAATFDGYPLAQQGKAGVALGAAASSSAVGGIIGILILMFLAPPIARVAVKFGPTETFWLAIFGISMVAVAAKEDLVKGLILAGFGLLLSVVGFDIVSGQVRLAFGSDYLVNGIPFIPVIVGLFAIGQALVLAETGGAIASSGKLQGSVFEGLLSVFKYPITVLKSTLVGFGLGAVPGIGVNIATLLVYYQTKRSSKTPEKFGKGAIEGVLCQDACSNAVAAGALIPTLTLGIPGSATCAIFLGAMMVHGMRPGMDLFNVQGGIAYVFFWGCLISVFMMLIVGVLVNPLWSRITILPNSALVSLIIMLGVLGSFADRYLVFDVVLAFIFGLLGYVFRKLEYPTVCLLLGLVLGEIIEKSYIQSLQMSFGSYFIFFTRPISLLLIFLILFSLFWPFINQLIKKRKGSIHDIQ